MLIVPLAVVGVALYFYFSGGRYQSTDDAYVEAAQMVISSNISGRVSEIDVRDNELVKKGAVLFRIDDAPFQMCIRDRGWGGHPKSVPAPPPVQPAAAALPQATYRFELEPDQDVVGHVQITTSSKDCLLYTSRCV